ncbi:hypothetical protein JCM8795_05170 [Hydrogenobaculum acidophilum]
MPYVKTLLEYLNIRFSNLHNFAFGPTIIAFTDKGVKQDVKSMLIAS